MDLEDLRAAQADERRSEKLQELPDSFYEDAAEYIETLREERDACDNPYSDEAQRLNDELGSARQVAEAVYERRVGKVVKMASLAANGHTATEDRMTREEREMYANIVDEIRAGQERVEGLLEGALTDDEGSEDGDAEARPGGAADEAADETRGGEGKQKERSDAGDGYSTVRVVESLPEFVGADGREYSLGEEDVARIPEENARALCEREAAVEVTQD
jgi:DNA replication factor GINS